MVKSAPGLRWLPGDITALRPWRGRAGVSAGGRKAKFAALKLLSGVTVEMTGPTANSFPRTRLRRMRRDEFSRRLMRETHLSADSLIYPVFVVEGRGERQPVASMPGVERFRRSVTARVRDPGAPQDSGHCPVPGDSQGEKDAGCARVLESERNCAGGGAGGEKGVSRPRCHYRRRPGSLYDAWA